jgi:histidine triad (HIT) family protein
MKPSIFTQIINGEIPCHKIYEDDRTFVFLDIHPVQPGHVLIVPKKQVEFVWDLENEDYQALMEVAQKIAKQLRDILDVPYVGEQIMGVDIPHAHIHLIPFTTGAEFRMVPDMDAEPDHPTLAKLADLLRMADDV